MKGIAIISFAFVLIIAISMLAARVNTLVKARNHQRNSKVVKDVETFLDRGRR